MASKILSFVAAVAGVALASSTITGCKSAGSEYLSPRVEGRVLDAQTHEPIYRACVLRIPPGSQQPDNFMRKGAEHAGEPFPAYTDKNGRFVIDAERALVLFAQVNWFSIDVSFEHSGYDRLVTNYTLFNATNTPSGVPLIKTGDIFLQRTQRKQKPKSS